MTMPPETLAIFELQRLALTLVEADAADDAETITHTLAAVTEPEIGFFLVALADLVTHALHADPTTTLAEFTARHRAVIDRAEQAHRDGA